MKDGLKVVHVSTAKSWRGGEQQLAYLHHGLAKLGCKQILFAPKFVPLNNYAQDNGWQIENFSSRGLLGILAAYRLKKVCSQLGVEVVHCHDAHAHTIAFLASKIASNFPPVVVSRQVVFPVKSSWFSHLKYKSNSVYKYICVSKAVKNLMSPVVGSDKVVVIYNGIDVKKYAFCSPGQLNDILNPTEGEYIIGSVAALSKEKDLATFLAVIANLRGTFNKRLKAVIIGAGVLELELKEKAQQLGVEDCVFFLGERDNVHQLLPDMDIFLLTSRSEGLCQSVLEAMAAGVSIVATRVGGIPEIVIDNKTGLLADAGNVELLAQHINRLLEKSELRASLKANAKAFASNFTFQDMAKKTLNIYQQIGANN